MDLRNSRQSTNIRDLRGIPSWLGSYAIAPGEVREALSDLAQRFGYPNPTIDIGQAPPLSEAERRERIARRIEALPPATFSPNMPTEPLQGDYYDINMPTTPELTWYGEDGGYYDEETDTVRPAPLADPAAYASPDPTAAPGVASPAAAAPTPAGFGSPLQGQATAQDLHDMAIGMLAEAQREGIEGMRAVGHVMANRANIAGITPSEVVRGVSQYSFTNDDAQARGLMDRIEGLAEANAPAYQEAVSLANDILSGVSVDPTAGATHYLNLDTATTKGWHDRLVAQGATVTNIGAHTFLSGTPAVADWQALAPRLDTVAEFAIPDTSPALALSLAAPQTAQPFDGIAQGTLNPEYLSVDSPTARPDVDTMLNASFEGSPDPTFAVAAADYVAPVVQGTFDGGPLTTSPTPGGGLVSDYGPRSTVGLPAGASGYHLGNDFSYGPGQTEGKPAYAAGDGTVSFAGVAGGYGNRVEIDHGAGNFSTYSHLQDISVQTGQQIGAGTTIGAIGNTGKSQAAHLHFEQISNGTVGPDGRAHGEKVDPAPALAAFAEGTLPGMQDQLAATAGFDPAAPQVAAIDPTTAAPGYAPTAPAEAPLTAAPAPDPTIAERMVGTTGPDPAVSAALMQAAQNQAAVTDASSLDRAAMWSDAPNLAPAGLTEAAAAAAPAQTDMAGLDRAALGVAGPDPRVSDALARAAATASMGAMATVSEVPQAPDPTHAAVAGNPLAMDNALNAFNAQPAGPDPSYTAGTAAMPATVIDPQAEQAAFDARMDESMTRLEEALNTNLGVTGASITGAQPEAAEVNPTLTGVMPAAIAMPEVSALPESPDPTSATPGVMPTTSVAMPEVSALPQAPDPTITAGAATMPMAADPLDPSRASELAAFDQRMDESMISLEEALQQNLGVTGASISGTQPVAPEVNPTLTGVMPPAMEMPEITAAPQAPEMVDPTPAAPVTMAPVEIAAPTVQPEGPDPTIAATPGNPLTMTPVDLAISGVQPEAPAPAAELFGPPMTMAPVELAAPGAQPQAPDPTISAVPGNPLTMAPVDLTLTAATPAPYGPVAPIEVALPEMTQPAAPNPEIAAPPVTAAPSLTPPEVATADARIAGAFDAAAEIPTASPLDDGLSLVTPTTVGDTAIPTGGAIPAAAPTLTTTAPTTVAAPAGPDPRTATGVPEETSLIDRMLTGFDMAKQAIPNAIQEAKESLINMVMDHYTQGPVQAAQASGTNPDGSFNSTGFWSAFNNSPGSSYGPNVAQASYAAAQMAGMGGPDPRQGYTSDGGFAGGYASGGYGSYGGSGYSDNTGNYGTGYNDPNYGR